VRVRRTRRAYPWTATGSVTRVSSERGRLVIRVGATKFMVMSAAPDPTAFAAGMPQVAGTYSISLKPSARSRSSATYWGATQMPVLPTSLIRVVSGGCSADEMSTRHHPSTPSMARGFPVRPIRSRCAAAPQHDGAGVLAKGLCCWHRGHCMPPPESGPLRSGQWPEPGLAFA